MKTLYTFCASALLFTSCERCFECRIMQSATNKYGQMQPQPPVITEQCGLTRREIKKYVEETTSTITVIISGKEYITQTTVFCKEQ
jgi:hypothetical protein